MVNAVIRNVESSYSKLSNGEGLISGIEKDEATSKLQELGKNMTNSNSGSDFLSFMNQYTEDDSVDMDKLISKAEFGPFNKPYHDYFDDAVDGVIVYNGIEIDCDYNNNALCIGDMGEGEDIFSVGLTHGKTLKVNRKNMDDLGHVMNMFSGEDQKLIVQGMLVDKMIKHSEFEMDEEKMKLGLTNSKIN